MDSQGRKNPLIQGGNDLALPTYAAEPPAAHSWEPQTPPPYDDQTPPTIEAESLAYRSFPPVITAFVQWGQVKSFHICGASDTERLASAEVHTGYGGKSPLGTKPGILLHDGTNTKDAILGAAGDESQLAARAYTFNLESIILMPPVRATGGPQTLVTERMRGRTSGDSVSFLFSIEVGEGEKMRREQFEWIKVPKGADNEVKAGGFRLEWIQCGPQTMTMEASSSSGHATSSSPAASGVNEAVAVLSWKSMFTSWKQLFTLRFVGSGASGVLGDRWRLMAILTALRLWHLKLNGRTNKGNVAMGEKIRRK
ncbi:hypothetical protein GQ53DRAFT_729835 [Thozetella sp. PMI_491]|nr:hypothetical protein GQ53DRAFT_729835 [Thozetella sp. PMI_491]